MPRKKKEEKKKTPARAPKPKVKKPKGIIEVGIPGEMATVDKGVKEVLYKGEVREIMECNTEERERELIGEKDSVVALDSKGNITTIYLK